MSTNYLALRSSAAPTFTVSTLLAKSISLQSTTITLGQSTNQSNNFSSGSFTTGWASTLTGLTSIKDVVLSPNGSVQTILQNSGSTMSTTITSLNSGSTWAGSTMRGLPTSGALPYQTYGSTINAMAVPSITAITAAPSGTNQLAIASNELVYSSANSGATFSPTGLGQNNSPFIYIPFDGSSVADVMGNATYASGSSTVPVYTTTLNKVGTQALSLVNTPSQSGNATNYQRWNWTGSANFTVSFWFNAQTPVVANSYQYIFTAYSGYFVVYLSPGGSLFLTIPSGGSYIAAAGGTGIATLIAANTWYNVVATFQTNGQCSLYLNNTFIGSTANVGGAGSTSFFSLGTFDVTLTAPFNGFIDDFRLYNYAVTNPSGAALINPLVGPIMPFVYLTFDGSTTTDLMGNSTTTATGSPGFVVGQVGSTALNLVNTAGGTATRYVRGTWTGATSWTVSFWVNSQSAGVRQILWGAYQGWVSIEINPANQIIFIVPNGVSGSTLVTSSASISLNTWYHIVAVFQSNGLCILYLNGTLIGTYTNSGGVGTLSTASFGVGAWDTLLSSPFNGYIDDFRIYNGAFTPSQLSPVLYSPSYAVGSPNIYLPFENGSVLDVMGYSAVSARGTMNFVPGVVGSAALNLVNPASGTPVNYIRGSWAGSPNSTVSLWFNLQSFGSATLTIFSAYQSWLWIAVTSTGVLGVEIPTGGAASGTSFSAMGNVTISLNTWYHVVLIFQTNALCSFYVNGSLIGTYTNVGGTGTLPSTQFSLGSYDNFAVSAFNGYIDDLKIYNCAVPFHALGPMNYTQAALSNTGAYQVVAAANGGVYTSANSGSSWSQAVTSPQPAAAVNTVGGQVITPQLTGLAAATWTQNGVNWVSSVSSQLGGTPFSYYAFQNTNDGNIWISAANYSSGVYNNTYSTTVLGIGTVFGEWLQIQSSVPLVITSYTFQVFNFIYFPKSYYIVGSSDGTTWYPVQSCVLATNPNTANNVKCSNNLLVNLNGTQTLTGNVSSAVTTTSYTTTTTPYTYFRIIVTGLFSTGIYAEIGEWYVNFSTPPTPLYVAPSTALIANMSAITVMPQQTGLTGNSTSSTPVATTWTTNGISWTSTASSVNSALYQPWIAFNNTVPTSGSLYSWASAVTYNTTTGVYTGSVTTTVLGGLGSITGEWIQLQSSIPLIMNSYTFGIAAVSNGPKNFHIVGSNDGTNWYPIQSVNLTVNPFTAPFTACSTYLIVNQSGTQTIMGGTAGSATCQTYPTTTTAYTYFRMIANTVVGGQYGNFEFTEWFINFTAYTPSLLQSLTMSPTGAHMALTGAGSTAPNLTGLTGATGSSGIVTSWTANGVTWTSSASNNTNAAPAWQLFNNAPLNTWVPTSATYTTAGNTSGVNNTFFTNGASTLTVQGDWAQLQSSSPLIMASYGFGCGFANTRFPKTYYIIGSNDAVTWYAIQSGVGAAAPTVSANYSLIGGTLLVNLNSAQAFGGSTITTITYSATTLPFLYFRLVITNSYSSSADVLEIAEWYINFQSGPTFYSTDYGSSWTRALSAATLPNANVLATSGGGQYSLQASGQAVTVVSNTFAGYSTGTYTTPTFSPALTFPVSNAALSATGEYMVILIQSTTNNVYYSTNYGVSFTGITLGSAAMVSCDISADGSYITVSSATQVFTLNRNAQGFSITVGNQSGLINQGLNAVAIGNQAGQINQSANSIILNASTAAVNSYVPGFFVAPVASAGSSISGSFAVLGYGTDSQVVQTGMTVLSNGTVGIGTTAPGTGFSSAIPNAKLTILNGVAGRENGKSRISIGGDASHYAAIEAEHIGSGATTLSFMTSTSAYTNSGNPETRMFIANNGNVGIGTTSLSSKLHIVGDLNTSAFTINNSETGWGYNFSMVLRNNQPNPSVFQFLQKAGGSGAYHSLVQGGDHIFLSMDQRSGVTGGNGIVICGWDQVAGLRIGTTSSNFSGNVGIGTAAPTASLDIPGSTRIGPSGAGIVLSSSWYKAGITADVNGPNPLAIGPYTDGNWLISFYNTVGGVRGTIAGVNSSSISFNTTSDQRRKDNIQDMPSMISKIKSLKPRSYTWKESGDKDDGFVAQEVHKVFPQFMTSAAAYCDICHHSYSDLYDGILCECCDFENPIGKDGTPHYYGLDYGKFTPYLTKALQETIEIVETQATQITALQAANATLQEENTQMKSQIVSLLTWAQTQGFSGTF